jgi:hypothetical protein
MAALIIPRVAAASAAERPRGNTDRVFQTVRGPAGFVTWKVPTWFSVGAIAEADAAIGTTAETE